MLAFVFGHHLAQDRGVLARLSSAPHNPFLHIGPGVVSPLPRQIDAVVLLGVAEHVHRLPTSFSSERSAIAPWVIQAMMSWPLLLSSKAHSAWLFSSMGSGTW